jgi:hypothetical protein
MRRRCASVRFPSFLLAVLRARRHRGYAFIPFLMVSFANVAAAENDDAIRNALRIFAEELAGATYFVPGWTPAQRAQEFQLLGHTDLKFSFERCTEPIEPVECGNEHKWRHYDQILMLTHLRPSSVKVLEVSGAVTSAGAADTSHALIYRCVQNLDCTSGDFGRNARPPIPCRDHDSCNRARAALEKLINLAQERNPPPE